MRRGVQLDSGGRPERGSDDGEPEPSAQAAGGKGVSGRIRDRTGADEEEAGGGGVQPLQAHLHEPPAYERDRAVEIQHSADWADGHGQDAAGTDAGQDAGRSVCDC